MRASVAWSGTFSLKAASSVRAATILSTFLPLRRYSIIERMEALALPVTAAEMDAPENWPRTLEAAKAGDLAAFERLMRQHERLVLRTARRILGNSADAHDVAQEVFLRLYRNLKKVETEGNLE